MNIAEYIQGLSISDQFTMSMMPKVMTVSLAVASICFIINISYNYLSSGASKFLADGEGHFPDYVEIARCLVVCICISIYPAISKTLVGTFSAVAESTEMSVDNRASLERDMAIYFEEQSKRLSNAEKTALESKAKGGEDAIAAEKVLDEKKKEALDVVKEGENLQRPEPSLIDFLSNPATWIPGILHSIVLLLLTIVDYVLRFFNGFILKLLVIFGPLAFAFSILPVFKKQLSVWFSALCGCCVVFIVLNVLDGLSAGVYKYILYESPHSFSDTTLSLEMLAIDLALLGAYCSCFWIAGKIVGGGDAGKIISRVSSILTSFATMVIAGKAVGAKAVGGRESSAIDPSKRK
ncbi:hypothetical protein [Bacteroides pyogenes]|jgi:hypothetical protein|uniref:Conjugative transposon TraJ C-terminal domain-containing protein n=1 Tax=Bacteroides pyogenes TaxID=310300 RepID=A0A5D3EB49_9BACE|nr:hypothetical protein [Bacteroides pyogenes]TYK32831.1 hypothetical protein FNJ60_10500 [Bacteroides pyogenes]